MFKRPHSSKTTTPIRSSDLRKLRQEILLQFPTSLTKDKDKLQLLLPDGTLTGKAKSHLDQQMTIFYSSNGDPRWFRTNSNLIPTCYTLDLLNDLLPRLSTNESVVENLISGSNLFLSGVDNSSIHELPQEIGKGDLCSIAVKERVVAVGYLASGRDELLKTNTGTAVITLHARGDYLWESGSKLELTSSSIDKTSIPMPIPTESPTSVVEEEQDSLTRDQVDEILHRSILLTISTLPTSNYPIPASSFYSSHILPNRPLPSTSSNVDLKKSNYKKLQQLIKYCHKQGWLVSKEVRGELLIMSGNQKHQDVLNLKKFKTVGSSPNVETSSNTTTTTTSNSVTTTTTSSSSVVVVNEYLKPCSPKIKQILSLIPHSPPPNDFYSFQILKQLFLNYLTNISKLVHPNSQKHFYTSPSPPPPSDNDNKKKETLSLESLSHQELLNSVLFNHNNHNEKLGGGGVMTKDEGFKEFLTNKGNFTEFWGLSLVGVDKEEEEILQKGRPPVIKIQIKNVGKRQVTLITGHEGWKELINSDSLAEELKHKSASSVSIQPLAGSAKKNQTPKMEIMCQGTHDKLITNLLSSKGVPKRYIEVDTTKSKK